MVERRSTRTSLAGTPQQQRRYGGRARVVASMMELQRGGQRPSTPFPRFESYRYHQSTVILRSALLRASRRTATGKVVPAPILRDAMLRMASQDDVRGLKFDPVLSDRFHGIDPRTSSAPHPRATSSCNRGVTRIEHPALGNILGAAAPRMNDPLSNERTGLPQQARHDCSRECRHCEAAERGGVLLDPGLPSKGRGRKA
jgi:hypothetical protein